MISQENARVVYNKLTALQVALCDVINDELPARTHGDSVALLKVLEDYYRRNLYPPLVRRSGG